MNTWKRYWPLLFLLMHACKMAFWFRGLDLGSEFPIVNSDFIIYYARALRAHEFFIREGRFWGYDPFQMAGYVSGPIHEVGSLGMSLLAHLLAPVVSIKYSLLIMVVGGFVAAPFILMGFVRCLGGGWSAAWAAFAVCTCTYGVYEPFSKALTDTGVFGSQMASFIGLWQVGLLWSWLRSGRWEVWLLWVAVSAFLPQLNPTSLLIVAVPNVLIVLTSLSMLDRRKWLLLLAAALLVAAGNWYWIKPALAFLDWRGGSPYLPSPSWQEVWNLLNPFQRSEFGTLQAIVLDLLLFLAACLLRRFFLASPKTGILVAVWLAWLLLIGHIGGAIPGIRNLQPYRFTLPAWLLIMALSAWELEFLMAQPRFLLTLGPILLAAPVFLPLMSWLQFLDLGHQPSFTTELPADQRSLLQFLRREGPLPGRLLLEIAESAGPHFSDIVPLQTGQPLSGGGPPANFLKSRFGFFMGSYSDGKRLISNKPVAFGRSLDQFGESEFAAYLELYNVGFVAARSPRSLEILDGFRDVLTPWAPAGAYWVYKVKGAGGSWFQEGSGELTADYDRLVVQKPSRGRLVLKFHWIKTFRADPPVALGPIFIQDDPVPFISVDNSAGHGGIVIFNAGL